MSLTEDNGGIVMPVAPAYGGNGNFGFGGDWASLIVLFLIFGMFNGGWGNGFGGGAGVDGAFPWLMTGQAGINANTNAGFDNAAIASQLNGIQTSLTTGFSNAEVAGCNRAMNSMQTAYQNQIADLERSFASQTATTQGFTDIASQLANCCCENRLATAQTQALVQSENCADRQALSDGIRDIIANQTAGFQNILNQMCNDKIDAKNEKIADLQSQLQMAQLAATQNAQTAAIEAGQRNLANEIESYIKPPINPAYVVPNPYAYYNTNCSGCNGTY